MSHVRVVPVLAAVTAGLVLASCQTIVEELPASAATQVTAVPLVVISLPQAPPQDPAPPITSGGSGGGGGGGTTPSQPTNPSQPTAAPPPQDNGCWRGNCNPVASIHAQVYYIQCHGQPVDNTKDATEGPADCDVVLDCTPKDASNRATQSGPPSWSISGGRRVVNESSFTPKVIGGGQSGSITFSCVADGVRSNVYTFTFR